jgi:dUTP pyrophosphatase
MSIKIYKQNPNALIPTRAHSTDIGLDLVAIKVHKVVNDETVMYDTGLVAIPPPGYYLEIIPRSSISKSGWILSNSIGVIDPSYRGNLYLVFTRVVSTAKDLKLPFCNCQLVLRKAEYAPVLEILSLKDESSSEIPTDRGDGGFGSTGSRIY